MGDESRARRGMIDVHRRGWRQGGDLAAVEQLVDR
jgi:hypothetical protein